MKIVKLCLAMTFAFGIFTTLQRDALGQQFKDLSETEMTEQISKAAACRWPHSRA